MGSSIALLILSAKGWLQIIDVLVGIQKEQWRVTSMFVGPNDYGQIVEQILPVIILGCLWLFYKWKTSHEKIYLYSLILQTITLLVSVIPFIGSFSRGAMSGFVGGGLFVIILYSVISIKRYIRYIFVIMLSILTVVGGFFAFNKVVDSNMRSILPSNTVQASLVIELPKENVMQRFDKETEFSREYDGERLLMWQSSYNMWKDYPFLGVGFDQWQKQYEETYCFEEAKERNIPMPHNNTVYFFSTTGLIGGIAYIIFSIGILLYFVKQMYKNPQNILLPIMIWMWSAIMIHGQVDSGITNKFVMHILCGTMGLVCGSIKRSES
ncbi:O-antigen ligase family protein [Veillonella denticariosi]|nr:O-antigen ligase family protein [Veillonella denticariosi]